jgi:hypothetical protein
MSKKWMGRLWRKFGFLLGPVGLGGCDKTTESYRAGCPDKVWPDHSFLADRSAVLTPLRQQAANGAVGGATLYNYYFESVTIELVEDNEDSVIPRFKQTAFPRPTARLSPWGKALLNRLARHANGQTLCVYVQTAVDLESKPSDVSGGATTPKNLNEQRVKEVQNFMAKLRPDLEVTVALIDPDPVGMTGPEARNGYSKMVTAPTGFLGTDAVLGASIGFGAKLGDQGGSGGGGVGGNPGQTGPPVMPDSPPSATGAPGGLGGGSGS